MNFHRTFTFLIGAMFLGIGIALPFIAPEAGWGGIVAAIVVGGLGLDAVVAALRNRPSLLARIGPLP